MNIVSIIKELIALLTQYLTPKPPETPVKTVIYPSSAPEPKPVSVSQDANKPKAPWFWKAKESEGKVETDPKFQEKMNPMWAKAGLPQFKGLVGSARAWCALFILANLAWAGYSFKGSDASAMSWDSFGQKIDWKTNGIPQGAIVRINHQANCSSTSNNHVTFANGDCAPADLLKPNAVFSGFGGNQSDTAKVSNYPVAHICAVRWPKEEPLPQKILKSVNCSNGQTASQESTK